jgi:hypothetical protein
MYLHSNSSKGIFCYHLLQYSANCSQPIGEDWNVSIVNTFQVQINREFHRVWVGLLKNIKGLRKNEGKFFL